jgi:hypothetical protein
MPGSMIGGPSLRLVLFSTNAASLVAPIVLRVQDEVPKAAVEFMAAPALRPGHALLGVEEPPTGATVAVSPPMRVTVVAAQHGEPQNSTSND